MTDFNVLIINYRNYMSIPRIMQVLHRAGCHVHLYACEHVYSRKSKYAHQYYPASSTMPDFLEGLKHLLETSSVHFDWIITVDDTVLIELANRLEEPWAQACLPVQPSPQIMDFLLSKFDFPMMAKQHDLPVPESHIVHSLQEAYQTAETLGYPVAAKARIGVAGSAIKTASNAEELATIFENTPDDALMLQEFIHGQIGGVTALFDKGRLLCWAAFVKEKTFPGSFGPAAVVRFIALPEMEPLLEKIGHLTGYHGIGGVDFMIDEASGRLVLIEQHARPTIQFFYANRMTHAFEKAIISMLSGQSNGIYRASFPKPNAHVHIFPQDVRRCIMDLDVTGLIEWLVCFWRWTEIPWDEPKLAFAYSWTILSSCKHKLQELVGQKVTS